MAENVLIIAEIGVNHNGDMQTAKELIKQAAIAGANIVKLQTFKADLCISQNTPLAEYQKKNVTSLENQLEMVAELELTESNHIELIETATEHGVKIFSTAFDLESLNFLSQFNFEFIKIPSGEITNLPLIRMIAKQNKKVILSTGMCSLGDVERSIDTLELNGLSREN